MEDYPVPRETSSTFHVATMRVIFPPIGISSFTVLFFFFENKRKNVDPSYPFIE